MEAVYQNNRCCPIKIFYPNISLQNFTRAIFPKNLLLEKYFEPKYFLGSKFLADKNLGVGRAQGVLRVMSSTQRDWKSIAEGKVKPTRSPPHTCHTRRKVLVPSLLSCGSLSSFFGCNTHRAAAADTGYLLVRFVRCCCCFRAAG